MLPTPPASIVIRRHRAEHRQLAGHAHGPLPHPGHL